MKKWSRNLSLIWLWSDLTLKEPKAAPSAQEPWTSAEVQVCDILGCHGAGACCRADDLLASEHISLTALQQNAITAHLLNR